MGSRLAIVPRGVHPDPALLREAVLAGIVPVRPSGTPLALGMRRSYRQVVQWIKPPSRLAVRAASVLRRLSSMRQAGPVPPGPPATTSPVAGSPMQPPTVSLRRASSSGGGGGFDVASGAAAAGASVTEAPIMAVSVPVPVATTVHVLAEAAMDELVGRRLAEQISEPQAKTLGKLVEQMERAARLRDGDAFYRLNLQFHDLLVEYAGNRKLASMYRMLVKELALARRHNLASSQVLPHSAAEHRNILDAILSRDAEAAARAMFEHAMRSKDRMLQAHLSGAGLARQRRKG